MRSFKINGGKSLKGIIHPQGAKNEALQILCAVLLTDDLVTIENNTIDYGSMSSGSSMYGGDFSIIVSPTATQYENLQLRIEVLKYNIVTAISKY